MNPKISLETFRTQLSIIHYMSALKRLLWLFSFRSFLQAESDFLPKVHKIVFYFTRQQLKRALRSSDHMDLDQRLIREYP